MTISKTLRAGISKQALEAKNLIKLSDIQKETLLGVVLGDVTIRPEGKLKFEQQYNKKDYIQHLYEVFKDFVNVPPAIRQITGGGANERFSIWFQTYTHNEFKIYRDIFYKNKLDENGNIVLKNEKPVFRKGICEVHFLEKWLTPRAIAYWFMDDGTGRRNDKNIVTLINLSSHGFSKEENEILSNFLNNKYNLNSKLYRDDTHFYINIKNVEIFRSLVIDYIHPDFFYKIHVDYDKNNNKIS